MGLTSALSNALSGLSVNQRTLDTVSRNIANSGTPGYHRQSVSIRENQSGLGVSAATTGITRAFNQTLQQTYTKEVSDSSYASTRFSFLDQLQSFFGKPGSAGSLDTQFSNFRNALQQLTTSPDSGSVRGTVVSAAQTIATTLNGLSSAVQDLRRQAETQISSTVTSLNNSLKDLADVNGKLNQSSGDNATRNALFDQRDRLIGEIAEQVDVSVTYRANGSVGVMTRGGIGLVDAGAATLSFTSGALSATSLYSSDPSRSTVGALTLNNGATTIDLVGGDLLQSGKLGALVELRDKSLVDAQNQLDSVAAGLARSFSTVTTPGSPVAGGFTTDLSNLQPGDDFELSYSAGGLSKTVRLVRVDDATKLPMDRTGSDGVRVIGIDFSQGMAAAADAIGTALGGAFSVGNPSGDTLQVTASGTTTIGSFVAHTTSTAEQGAGLGVALFVDNGGTPFTGSLDGLGQTLGFAGRIALNADIVADPTLLVKSDATSAIGQSERPDYLLKQLDTLRFGSAATTAPGTAGYRLSGTVSDLVSQTIDYQGSVAERAGTAQTARSESLSLLNDRMDSEYGVNVDDEMARLLELQTAYAANARIITVVQELIDTLLNA